MANTTKQRLYSLALIFGFLGASTNPVYSACSRITASFSYTKSKSCGVPVVISLTNTSTGTSQNVATYSWYVGTTLLKKGVGKSGTTYKINTPGTYVFKLLAKDTGAGCLDSATQTVVVSPVAPKIKDGNGIFTYNPFWENCISSFGAPDTFGLKFEVQDSLKNYTIIWGDGTSNSTGTLLLKTQSIYHKYNSLGQFQVKVISSSGGCTDSLTGTVVNERNPVAGLIGPPTGTNQGCVPLTVRFINNSSKSSPTTTFTWDMGDGFTKVLPASTYLDTLYYTYRRFKCNGVVKLTMTNSCGSSYATWNPIQASSKDSAIIKANNPANCDLTKDFSFDNASEVRFCSSPNPRKYFWDWGDGTNSGWTTSTATQLKKYTARGTYTIRLIDSNSCGKDTGFFILKIDSLPKVSGTASIKSGCSPLTVSFNDNSTGATSRTWNFGDGSGTSSAKSPTHVYTTGGNFKAILSITNNCGTRNDTFNISVKQKVKAGFSYIPGGCAPFVAKFTNTSVKGGSGGSPTYRWFFGDGTSSTSTTPPDKTYSALGTYMVMLIATDSCGSDTFKQSFQVYNKPTGTITVKSGLLCPNSPLTINVKTVRLNTATIVYGDGTSPIVEGLFGGTLDKDYNHSYSTNNTYKFSVYLNDANGCKDTTFLNIKVEPKPTVNFTSDKSDGCGPLAVTFTNTSIHNGGGTIGQMKFVWDYKNGTKSFGKDSVAKFNFFKTRDTIYAVKLIGTNSFGCKDSITKSIRVYPKPLSRFTLSANAGCAPLNITTSNTSMPYDTGSISVMSFVWNFGNGKKAFRQDSAARFTASKTKDTLYNVSLIASSEHGCLDTSVSVVRVYPKPKSQFTRSVSSGCKPLTVNFNNTSTPYDTGSISIMTFNWKFGNFQTSTKTQASSVYTVVQNKDSVYNVSLEAISEHGCKDTSYSTVLLHPNPSIKFLANKYSGCGPLSVNFTNNSINAKSFTWQFGAYGTDTVKNPNKVFYGRAIFDSIVVVKLSAKSNYGCNSDTVQEKITVFGTPIANYLISKDTFCFPDKMQFLNQSLAAYNYKWDLGDGTVTTQTNPVHFFKKGSNPFRDTTYFINMVATSPYGCKDTARGTMTVLPYPIPKFSVDNPAGCAPHTVKFTNNSVNVLKYFWVFGDGYTSTQPNPTHTFINTGIGDTAYQVILYTYSLECVDSISIWIPVYKPSFSFFRTDRVKACDAGYFTFNSFAENAPSVLYKFGDGTSSTQPNEVHLFPTSPYRDTSFTTTLYTTSARGCTDSFKRTVTLPQRLKVAIKDTSMALCAPALVNFQNYTQGAITYIWDFGDNSGSSQRNPLHEYQKPGTFKYKLYAFDANGCMDSAVASGQIRVDVSPKADYDFSPGKGRMPNDNRIFFTDKSRSAIPLTYKWDFSDPNGNPPTSTLQNASHDFSDSGTFKVCLMVDNGGCADTFCNFVRIEPAFPKPEFIVDRDSGCPPLTVQFTNQSINSDRYIWFFGDGERSEEKDPVHTYKYSGYYDVILIAKGPGGEGKTEKKQFIKVLNAPYSYFNLTPAVLYLPDAKFMTRNLTTGAISYSWQVYNSATGALVGTSKMVNPYFRVYDTGYYDVELISTSNQGCSDTLLLQKPVFVNPKGIIHVPDAFTPTNDDRNEVFKPSAINVQKSGYKFMIYNRWGEIVFETTDPDQGWDGNYRSKFCPTGVYVYKINAKLFSGDDITAEGSVHLIR